jgi:hypothetical protein
MAISIDKWTPALEAELAERREAYNVLKEDRLQERMISLLSIPRVTAGPRLGETRTDEKR